MTARKSSAQKRRNLVARSNASTSAAGPQLASRVTISASSPARRLVPAAARSSEENVSAGPLAEEADLAGSSGRYSPC
jgi:hypothetical protein